MPTNKEETMKPGEATQYNTATCSAACVIVTYWHLAVHGHVI